jgi:hypothetical protein
MIKILNASMVFVILLMISSCSNDQEEIIVVFNKYRDSISTKNGRATAELIDKNSLEWYDSIKSLSIYATREVLSRKNYITKLNVLALRQFYELPQIEKMNAKEIFAFTVDNSFYAQEVIKEFSVGGIEIKDGKAAVVLKRDKNLVRVPLKFIEEEDGWKINLASVINMLNRMISGNPWGDQESENVFVLNQVASVSRQPMKEKIWEPLKIAE